MWNLSPSVSRRVRCLSLIPSLVMLACVPGVTQNSDSPAQADQKQMCIVEGAVVRAEDSLPLKNASVILVPENDREIRPYRARTDSDGHFMMQKVAAGRYYFRAGHNGFVDKAYGSTIEEGVILALLPGQHVKGVLFRLLRQAVITGRVVDEDGEPLARAAVTAVKKVRYDGKVRFFPAIEEAETDDLGGYRIFGLRPGSYFVGVNLRSFRYGLSDEDSEDAGGRNVPVFFPGTVDATQAEPLQVHAGEEVRADVTVIRVRGVDIQGIVKIAVPGAPTRVDAWVVLVPINRIVVSHSPLTSDVSKPDNSFEFHGVPPGSYELSIHVPHDGKVYGAEQHLEVGTGNISGVTLVVGVGISIPGRVRIEGEFWTASERLMVSFLPENEEELAGARGEVKSNGSFTVEDVHPGKYTVRVWGLPKDTYIKSIHFGSQDVTSSPLTVATDKGAGPIEIVLRRGAPAVTGLVSDADGKPVPGATVALIPDSPPAGRDDFYRTTRTDQYGRFSLNEIMPGKYKAFAWDVVESDTYEDPDFLKKFEDRATKLDLQERDNKTANLTVIRTGVNPDEQ